MLPTRFNRLSLRAKATLLAIALGTVPVLAIGGAAYLLANRSITQQTIESKQTRAVSLADKVNRFMFERYGDIQVLANLTVLRNAGLKKVISPAEQSRVLTDYTQFYGVYDSIAVFDLDGNPVVQSQGSPLGNHRDRGYFQQALKTGKAIISAVEVSKSNDQSVIHFAAPVRDSATNKVIGVVRTRMPIKYLEDVVRDYAASGDEYHLLDSSGKFFIAAETEQVGRDAWTDFPRLAEFKGSKNPTVQISIDQIDKAQQVAAYAPLGSFKELPDLGWSTIVATDTKIAFAAQRQLLLTLALGTGAAAILVSIIATVLANRAVRPIQAAAQAVENIGQGNLETRLQVAGEDELAVLGSNINLMAEQIETLVENQKAETERIEQARQEARQEADARAEEQRHQKETLQKRALELLMEVDPVSRGDLTIRAQVTPDEVGTIADSYNAIIRSLRQIVQQVKTASASVTETASSNETAVSSLSEEATQQMKAIAGALQQIEAIATSIQGVATRAKQAEIGVQKAGQTLRAGDEAMNRTVSGISAIRTTVSETAKKVKRLGEASQKISKVVNLIGNFAAQTNLLALNAAIEAARAGEEGRGFAVVAEEVRSLAQQSTAATAEIEQLVEEIQSQTNEVVTAMEAGTEQVVAGTQLVEETRQKLSQISAVSAQINKLVKEISQATAVQTQVSTTVTQTMQAVAQIAGDTSRQSETVAQSFTQLLAVAENLQVSVAKFKVG
ncbi:methyl-accepting chemotaxis protein [Leptolyngbya sp. 'hensonii']|nr:methyl-accepting chemotaxis protein [Leptolyngbya sp. 'hensonii']